MCAINPKREMHLTLSVYTGHEMSKNEFETLAIAAALNTEIKLNEDARLRWHLTMQEGSVGNEERASGDY